MAPELNVSPWTVASCAAATAVAGGLLFVQRREAAKLHPRRLVIAESRVLDALGHYGTVGLPPGEANGYYTTNVRDLLKLARAARYLGVDSSLQTSLDGCLREQALRVPGAGPLPEGLLSATATLDAFNTAGVVLPSCHLDELRLEAVKERADARRYIFRLLRCLVAPTAQQKKLRPAAAAGTTGLWAASYATAMLVTETVQRSTGILLRVYETVETVDVGPLRHALPWVGARTFGDDGVFVYGSVVRLLTPIVKKHVEARLLHGLHATAELEAVAMVASADQASLDVAPRNLASSVSSTVGAVCREIVRLPERFAAVTTFVAVTAMAAWRRELPLLLLSGASLLTSYDAVHALTEYLAGTDAALMSFLRTLDDSPVDPGPPLVGIELLLAAGTEPTPSLDALVEGVATSSLAGAGWGTASLLQAAQRHLTVLRKTAPQSAVARQTFAVQYLADQSAAAADGTGIATQALDPEERWLQRTAGAHIPLLPLQDWDENTFVTLRCLGVELLTASKALAAARAAVARRSRRDVADSIMQPHSSVFVDVVLQWRSYVTALVAQQLISRGWCGSEAAPVESVTAPLLLGAVRFMEGYEDAVSGTWRAWQSYSELEATALGLRVQLRELRHTIDMDPCAEGGCLVDPRPQARSVAFPASGTIAFRDVRFAYPAAPGHDVLRGITCAIPLGRTTGIVGPTGGGKSTLLLLLKRLYDPCGGSVSVADRDLRAFDVQALRRSVGYVPQHPDLLPGRTAADQIAFGADVTRAEVVAAARIARCHEFIDRLPRGYDTPLRESALSGGELQRVALARCFVRNPSVLLLDEATSALDADNEQAIFEALRDFGRGRTVVIIAHRLSTLRGADHIIAVEGGRCAEEGSPQQLFAQTNGGAPSLYRRYCDEQQLQARRAKLSPMRRFEVDLLGAQAAGNDDAEVSAALEELRAAVDAVSQRSE